MITIRTEEMSDIFTKYHLDGLPCAAVLHHFTAPDTGDPHDHPWSFRSYVISGWYREVAYNRHGQLEFEHFAGDAFDVPATRIHRITAVSLGGVWTLITPDPNGPQQTSGFYQFRNDGLYHRFWHEQEFKRRA